VPVSPYIKWLRGYVGSQLILVPSVSTLVRDDGGRVLLVYEEDADGWSTPGGSIDIDEVPEIAARREVLEETGLVVRTEGILTVLGGPEFHAHYKNGDEVAYVATVYRGIVEEGTLRPDGDEVTAAKWFTVDELRDLPLSNFAKGLFRHLEWL
jgi:ADP-ribose pyrophosphatase YjhB (NUDIX family)